LKTSNLILDLEFHQYLGSLKHVINIIMGFRDMGCYIYDFMYGREVVMEPNPEGNTIAVQGD
jgi:hypothetical protein